MILQSVPQQFGSSPKGLVKLRADAATRMLIDARMVEMRIVKTCQLLGLLRDWIALRCAVKSTMLSRKTLSGYDAV